MDERKNHTKYTSDHSEHISKEFDFPTFNTKGLAVLKVWAFRDFEFPATIPLEGRSENIRNFSGNSIQVVASLILVTNSVIGIRYSQKINLN